MTRLGIALVLLLLGLPATTLAHDGDVEFAVFSMNTDLPALTLSKTRMLYKGKTKKVNGAIKVVLVDLPKNSILREEFYSQLLGKSVAQMSGYWASLSFSGKGNPPDELNSDDILEILSWLNSNPNGVAYAPVSDIPEGANILITFNAGE